eukprot:7732882-Karenia_brevis.AAC.1
MVTKIDGVWHDSSPLACKKKISPAIYYMKYICGERAILDLAPQRDGRRSHGPGTPAVARGPLDSPPRGQHNSVRVIAPAAGPPPPPLP